MKAIIIIDMDNAAFREDENNGLDELARIFKQMIKDDFAFKGVYDSNGNKVGTFEIV